MGGCAKVGPLIKRINALKQPVSGIITLILQKLSDAILIKL
jgi:hypothetical protein